MAHSGGTDSDAARMSLSMLQSLLKDYHPRDFAFRLWNGSAWEAEPGQPVKFTMVLHHPGALRSMFFSRRERALAQAYIYDDFDIEGNLESAFPMADYLLRLRLGLADRAHFVSRLLRLPAGRQPRVGRQPAKLHGTTHSVERDKQAVTYHYDTSNDFFALYLDRRMVYSCAYFENPDEDLDIAQERKLNYICRKLRLKKGERLLDIGCGWGGLVIHAAKEYGVTALGVTLSEPQASLANERIKSEGLQDRCRVELRDYREIDESTAYDKLVSIGMVEHVGEQKLEAYFGKAWRLLRPGGVFLNHGIAHARGPSSDRNPSFSQAYVFPDGEPVPISVSTRAAENAGFEVRDLESLREHYALTLRQWVRRLEEHHEQTVRATDEATYRTWRLFMSGSAYQFSNGSHNIYQSLLVKQDRGKSGLPLTRADWYRPTTESHRSLVWSL
jgi:cyclopropane-fatty-acyl-phospholipid synthase